MNLLGFAPCLEAERPGITTDPSRALFRAKKMLPELVYDTGALEDRPYTFPEVQTQLEDITVGRHRLSVKTLILAKSWRALIKLVERGVFRTSAMSIANTFSRLSSYTKSRAKARKAGEPCSSDLVPSQGHGKGRA